MIIASQPLDYWKSSPYEQSVIELNALSDSNWTLDRTTAFLLPRI